MPAVPDWKTLPQISCLRALASLAILSDSAPCEIVVWLLAWLARYHIWRLVSATWALVAATVKVALDWAIPRAVSAPPAIALRVATLLPSMFACAAIWRALAPMLEASSEPFALVISA